MTVAHVGDRRVGLQRGMTQEREVELHLERFHAAGRKLHRWVTERPDRVTQFALHGFVALVVHSAWAPSDIEGVHAVDREREGLG